MTFDPHAQRLLFIPKSYLFRQDLHLIDFGPLEKKLPASLELLMTACINGQVDLWHDHPELFESLDEQWRSFVQLLLEKKQTHCTLS